MYQPIMTVAIPHPDLHLAQCRSQLVFCNETSQALEAAFDASLGNGFVELSMHAAAYYAGEKFNQKKHMNRLHKARHLTMDAWTATLDFPSLGDFLHFAAFDLANREFWMLVDQGSCDALSNHFQSFDDMCSGLSKSPNDHSCPNIDIARWIMGCNDAIPLMLSLKSHPEHREWGTNVTALVKFAEELSAFREGRAIADVCSQPPMHEHLSHSRRI